MRRLLTLGQPHRNTAIRAHLQSRRSLALLVVLVLCLSAFVLAANEAWAKEQPSRAAQQGPAEGMNIANGKVAVPVPVTPTPPVASPPVQVPPAVTPPVQVLPAEDLAPAPPKSPPESETPPPAKEPSPPPVDPAPSTPEPDPAPQPTPQPAPQAGGEKDVESDPVPNTSRPPTTDSDRVVEPKWGSTASPNVIDEGVDEVVDSAPARAPAPAAPAATDDGHVAGRHAVGPAPDRVLPLPAPAAASDRVPPAASGGVTALVQGRLGEPDTPPAAAPMAQWVDEGSLAAVSASAVGEALRLSAKPATRAAGALGSAVESIESAAASAATSVASATAEVFRTLAGGSAGSSSTDATSGNQQAPSDGAQDPVAPLVPPLGDSLFSPFTGAGPGQLGAGGGLAPLLVGILALLTVSLSRRDFKTYLIACEMPKPSSALLRPLERPG